MRQRNATRRAAAAGGPGELRAGRCSSSGIRSATGILSPHAARPTGPAAACGVSEAPSAWAAPSRA